MSPLSDTQHEAERESCAPRRAQKSGKLKWPECPGSATLPNRITGRHGNARHLTKGGASGRGLGGAGSTSGGRGLRS